MTTNFRVWTETADATSQSANVESSDEFKKDETRTAGWKANDVISAIKMNSILRQNSLIAVALAEAFLSNKTTLSILSSVEDVSTALLASIASKAEVNVIKRSMELSNLTMAELSASVESMETAISNLSSGTVKAGDSNKLDGKNSSYFQKAITSGTANPSGGANGDIYIKYS